MQATSRVTTKYRVLFSIVTLSVLGGCASNGARVASENPFKDVQGRSLADLAGSGHAPFKIIFTGNVMGEFEPCGCAVGPKGGLDRRLNFVKQNAGALVLDAGNALFPSRPVDASRIKSLDMAALEIAKAHVVMGVRAQNVGELDLARGLDLVKDIAKKSGLKVISTNLVDEQGKAIFAAKEVVDMGKGKTKAHIFGLYGDIDDKSDEYKVLNPTQALKAQLSGVPAGDFVIVLSDLGIDQDEKLIKEIGYGPGMLVIGSRDHGSLQLPKQVGSSLIVQSQFRGQQWGVLDIAFSSKSHKGWYSPELGNRFSTMWNDVQTQIVQDRERIRDSSELRIERKRHDASLLDLMAYAPSNVSENTLYKMELIDLGDLYRKSNELSTVMKKLGASATK